MRIASTILATLALAVTAAPASASWSRVNGWTSPSGAVACSLEQREGADAFRVACHQYAGVSKAGRTRWLVLGEHGRARSRRGLVYQGDALAMPYGQTWFLTAPSPRLSGDEQALRCRVTVRNGMRCTNEEGRGIVVRRGVLRRF
jgi:hypothetical protein